MDVYCFSFLKIFPFVSPRLLEEISSLLVFGPINSPTRGRNYLSSPDVYSIPLPRPTSISNPQTPTHNQYLLISTSLFCSPYLLQYFHNALDRSLVTCFTLNYLTFILLLLFRQPPICSTSTSILLPPFKITTSLHQPPNHFVKSSIFLDFKVQHLSKLQFCFCSFQFEYLLPNSPSVHFGVSCTAQSFGHSSTNIIVSSCLISRRICHF